MPYLSDAELDDLRHRLDQREATLVEEIRTVGDSDTEPAVALSTDVGDAVDVGDTRYQTGMAHVDKQRDQEELMAIQAARERMADGSYGECVDCGEPIPRERLKAQPTALRCVPCQAVFEKTHPAAPVFSV